MDGMSNFTVIPALDLKGAPLSHAVAGNRAEYRPIASPFGAADDPAAIARGLLATTGSPSLYIADLDAIAGIGNHFELVRGLSYALPGTTLWIDAGFSDVADCAFWLPLGATLVIGSESLAAVDDWREIHGRVRRERRAVARFRLRRTTRSRAAVQRSRALAQAAHRHGPDQSGHEHRPRCRSAQNHPRGGRFVRRVRGRRRAQRARPCRHRGVASARGRARHGAAYQRDHAK